MVPGARHGIPTLQSSLGRKSAGPGQAGLSFMGENSAIWNRERQECDCMISLIQSKPHGIIRFSGEI